MHIKFRNKECKVLRSNNSHYMVLYTFNSSQTKIQIRSKIERVTNNIKFVLIYINHILSVMERENSANKGEQKSILFPFIVLFASLYVAYIFNRILY